MRKVHVFGYTGMLGRYVYAYLKGLNFEVVGVGRNQIDARMNNTLQPENFNEGDVFINCVGAIPQRGSYSKYDFILINAAFPHFLSEFCAKNNIHFIHATTDCVYDGSTGLYCEKSDHTAKDVYGKSKSLGEPDYGSIIRTSIIGEELVNKKSLLEWAKSNKNKVVNGYNNHYWNGITCLQFAKICAETILEDKYWTGVKHINAFSGSPVVGKYTKYALLTMISNTYDLSLRVKSVAVGATCDRALMSMRNDINFKVPDLSQQLEEQKDFYPILKSVI